MAYFWIPPEPHSLPVCRCQYGVTNGVAWVQITSDCPSHFPPLPVSVRVRILLNEGVRV